jgi:hypothetical protein
VNGWKRHRSLGVRFRSPKADSYSLETRNRGERKENRASRILRKRALASQRGASISSMLAQELTRIADRESEYELACSVLRCSRSSM